MVTPQGLTPCTRLTRLFVPLLLVLLGSACTADDATLVSPLDDARRESLAIAPASFDVIEGRTLPLSVTQNGGSVAMSDVVWSVTPAWAATIDERGILTALGASPVAVRASLRGLQASVSGTIHGQPVALTSDAPVLRAGYAGRTVEDSITIQVTSQDGSPVPGVEVSFSIDSGSGSLSHELRTTDAEGLARVAWTLGTTPRLETLTARAEGIEPVHFQVDVSADAASSVVHVVSGGDQEAEAGEALPQPIVVQIRDQYGNPVPALGVQWIFPSGEGAAPDLFEAGQVAGTATTFTDDDGLTAVRWRLGTEAGDHEVAILLMLPDSESGTGAAARWWGRIGSRSRAGVPRRIRINPGSVSMQEGESATLSATVTDRYGNRVDTATVEWGSGNTQIATVDAQGRVLGQSQGATEIRAVSGRYSASAGATVTATAEPQLRIHGGDDQVGTVGSSLPEALVVQAVLPDGTPVPGVQLTWTVPTGSGSVQGATTTTDHNGAARAAWTMGTSPGVQSVTVSDGANSVRYSARAGAGPVAELVLRPDPAAVDAGDKLALQAVARDAFGNPTAWQSISWASHNTGIASVDGFGLVSGKQGGMAQIEATADGVRAGAEVEVKAIAPPPAPSLTIATPSTGPSSGGTAVVLSGTDFQSGAAVRFGGSSATGVTVQSATRITASAPTHAAGTVDVIVTNPDGRADTLRSAFTYQEPAPAPVVSLSVTPDPASVDAGAQITLSASARDAAGNATTWQSISWTSSNPAVATVDSDGVVSGHQPGWAFIQANADGVKAGAEVQVKATASPPATPAPSVTTISPTSGPVAGGTAVTLQGSGFQSGATVTFGSTAAASVTFGSATSVTAIAPAGAAGTVPVTLTNPDGQTATLAAAYTFVAAAPSGAAPQPTSISREVGSTNGGTRVRIDGSNFAPGALVRFGGVVAQPSSVTATSLVVDVPAHSAGRIDVAVVNPDQASGTLNQAFEYLPAPTAVHVQHDFEDGTFGRFLTSGSIQVGNWGPGTAMSGTMSTRSVMPIGSVGNGALHFAYTPGQPANTSTGVYQRWYVRMDQNTLAAVRSGQIKLLLNRSGGNPPSWLHVGIGGHFPAQAGRIGVLKDYNTGLVDGGQSDTRAVMQADQWVEIQTWYQRSSGRGRARMWIDGKQVLDHTDGMFGTDDTSRVMKWHFGLAFTQSTTGSGNLTVYVDDAVSANGFIDPVR